jgi:hypothetical protein
MSYHVVITKRLDGYIMTAKEAHQAQWQALKDKPLSDKLKYIFTYYWPGILGVICVLIFAASWITSALSQKEIVLSGYLVNSATNQSYTGNFRQEVMDHLQIDSNEYDLKLTSDVSYSPTEFNDTSVAILESIIVQTFAGELDFVVIDLENAPVLSAYYADLRLVLTKDQLQQWKDHLVYVEQAELEELVSGTMERVILPKYHLNDEGLKNPVPVGICLPKTSKLFDAYKYPPKDVIFSITHNAKHIENTLRFLEYIMA